MKCPHSKNYERNIGRHDNAASLHDACAICGKEVRNPVGWIYTDANGDMIAWPEIPKMLLAVDLGTMGTVAIVNAPVGRWCANKHRDEIGEYLLKSLQ